MFFNSVGNAFFFCTFRTFGFAFLLRCSSNYNSGIAISVVSFFLIFPMAAHSQDVSLDETKKGKCVNEIAEFFSNELNEQKFVSSQQICVGISEDWTISINRSFGRRDEFHNINSLFFKISPDQKRKNRNPEELRLSYNVEPHPDFDEFWQVTLSDLSGLKQEGLDFIWARDFRKVMIGENDNRYAGGYSVRYFTCSKINTLTCGTRYRGHLCWFGFREEQKSLNTARENWFITINASGVDKVYSMFSEFENINRMIEEVMMTFMKLSCVRETKEKNNG